MKQHRQLALCLIVTLASSGILFDTPLSLAETITDKKLGIVFEVPDGFEPPPQTGEESDYVYQFLSQEKAPDGIERFAILIEDKGPRFTLMIKPDDYKPEEEVSILSEQWNNQKITVVESRYKEAKVDFKMFVANIHLGHRVIHVTVAGPYNQPKKTRTAFNQFLNGLQPLKTPAPRGKKDNIDWENLENQGQQEGFLIGMAIVSLLAVYLFLSSRTNGLPISVLGVFVFLIGMSVFWFPNPRAWVMFGSICHFLGVMGLIWGLVVFVFKRYLNQTPNRSTDGAENIAG